MASIKVTIHIAWWVRWYIGGVALFSFITGMEPDMEKVKAKVLKGVRLK